jgi:diguanylate cyclase (GGDEF)-like protein/PAS domain S-box-containing protein
MEQLGVDTWAIAPVPAAADTVLCILGHEARRFDAQQLAWLATWLEALGAQLSLADAMAHVSSDAGLYKAALGNMPGAVLVFDHELVYRVAEGNELYKSAGFGSSELVGKSLLEVLEADERAAPEALYRATLRGSAGSLEMRRKHNWYAVHTLPLRDESGRVTHGMLTAYNVTDLKTTQEALADKTRILASILANMSEGLIVADGEGKPILFNPAGARILGADCQIEDADAVPEHGLYLSDKTTRLAAGEEPLTRALGGERVEQMEVFARTPEWPAGRWYSVNAGPLLDGQGKQLGGICVVRDVTVAKEAELSLREQTGFVELLQKITLSANSAKSGNEALEQCLGLVCRHMAWPVGHVYMYASSARELVPSNVWHLDDPAARRALCEITGRTRLPAGEGLPGKVLQTARTEWIEDMSQAAADSRAQTALAVGVRAAVAFPVLIGADVVAVLEFFSDLPGHPHDRLLKIMENVGVQLGRAVERERHLAAIEALSLTDELTGLCNRRGFLEHARRQVKILRRQRRPALLFFADLDGLKQINDTLGHEAGDAAIVAAADVLRQSFRDTDVIARFGGDEFVVLVAETDHAVSVRMLERIEGNLRRKNAAEPRRYTIGMSVGVSIYDPEEPLPLEELLARADAAMYQQKQLRRGQAQGRGTSA